MTKIAVVYSHDLELDGGVMHFLCGDHLIQFLQRTEERIFEVAEAKAEHKCEKCESKDRRQELFRETVGRIDSRDKMEFTYDIYGRYNNLLVEGKVMTAHRDCFDYHKSECANTIEMAVCFLEVTNENFTEEDAECKLCGR